MTDEAKEKQAQTSGVRSACPILHPKKDASGKIVITDEMREMAHALTHPDGDPYLNGRELGFYCEQCG